MKINFVLSCTEMIEFDARVTFMIAYGVCMIYIGHIDLPYPLSIKLMRIDCGSVSPSVDRVSESQLGEIFNISVSRSVV